ncbi:MAG: hypothetical protein U1E17_16810 [Geminicoccaceae bacterium]
MDKRFARNGFEFRSFGLQPWKVWALAIVGGAVLVTAMVALAGLMLVLVPVVLLAGLAARLLLGSGRGPMAARRAPQRPDVIEGRYEVVEVGPTSRANPWRNKP